MNNKRYQASRVLVALFLFFFVICPLIAPLVNIDAKDIQKVLTSPVIRIPGLCTCLVYEPFPYPASLCLHHAVHTADAYPLHLPWDGAGTAVR